MEGPTFAVILLILVMCVHTGRTDDSTQIRHQEKRSRGPPNRISHRLPTNVRPTHYDLKLKPQIYEGPKEDFSFEGSVTIYVECLQATNVIVLHQNGLDIDRPSISVTKEGDQTNLFTGLSLGPRHHFLRLHLSRQLEVQQRYVVEFGQFSGPLSTDGYGLYLSYYNDGNDEVYLVASQLQSVHARKAFPCFDEPQLKATFNVTLVRRKDTGRNYFSLSNSRNLSSSIINSGPWVEDRFETTPMMSTYLLAFVICDFEMEESYSSTQPPVMYRTFAPRTVMQKARRTHQIGVDIFNYINGVFQPTYSQALTKMDNVWVPHFNFAAMENWGLIIYSMNLLHGTDNPQVEMQLFGMITHELAHQWFGNFVSPKWWKWGWLNEGFAFWFDKYITEEVFPRLNMTHEWLGFHIQPAMETDSYRTSHALEIDPVRPEQTKNSLDNLVYVKGSALVRMMQFVMGADTFIRSLNDYLTTYEYDNADSTDLFTVLDEAMKNEGYGDSFMTNKMTSWVSQQGFPVVEVHKTATGYTLSQKRYLARSATGDDSYWEIPITYATLEDTSKGRSRSDIEWLSGQDTLEINTAPYSWILVNIDQIAFCRVLYDRDSWDALIGQLNHNHTVISVINRAQIINDAWAFTIHQKLDLSIALRTLDFLKSELELLPWLSFQHWTSSVEMDLQTSDMFDDFQNYMRTLLQHPVEQLTLDILNDTSPTDALLRGTLAKYACKYNLTACVEQARTFFNDWKQTGVFRSHSTLRDVYFCAAVADSDDNWQYALTQYTSSDVPDDNKPPLSALGCSTNPDKLREFLYKCLDGADGIARSETPNCVNAMIRSASRQVALDFLLDYSYELQESFADHIETMVNHVTAPFYSTEFFDDYLPRLRQVFTNIQDELNTVENKARTRFEWMEANKVAIQTWLNNSWPLQPV